MKLEKVFYPGIDKELIEPIAGVAVIPEENLDRHHQGGVYQEQCTNEKQPCSIMYATAMSIATPP